MRRTRAKGWWGMIHRGKHSQKHYGRVHEIDQCGPNGPTMPKPCLENSEVRFMSVTKHMVIRYHKIRKDGI